MNNKEYRTKNYETMKLEFEFDNQVAIVYFDRPDAMNAANVQMSHDRLEIFEAIAIDDDIKVVIMTGGEKVYCAGGDLETFSKFNVVEAREFSKRGLRYQKVFSEMPKPVIAAIAGYAFGGGMENVLMTDLRIAATNAKFGLPEINVGIFPGGGGTQRLVQNIPIALAKEMIYFGKTIDADEAKNLGIVNEVVEVNDLLPTAKEWAKKLLRKPPLALKAAKAAIDNAWNMDIDRGMDYETLAWSSLYDSDDQKEGMNAFLEKRKPTFKGK